MKSETREVLRYLASALIFVGFIFSVYMLIDALVDVKERSENQITCRSKGLEYKTSVYQVKTKTITIKCQ